MCSTIGHHGSSVQLALEYGYGPLEVSLAATGHPAVEVEVREVRVESARYGCSDRRED